MAALIPVLLAFGAAFGLSAALAVAAGVSVWRGWASAAGLFAAVAAGVGYSSGHLLLSGWPGLPPADTTHWLAFLAPAAAVAWAVARLILPRPSPLWVVGAVGAVAGAGTAALVFISLVRHTWTPGQAALHLALAGAGLSLLFLVYGRLGRTAGDLPVFAAVLTALTCASASLVVSGSMLLGQLAGVMCLALAPVAVAALFLRGTTLSAGCAAVAAIGHWGLVLLGYHFANLPGVAAVLLLLAPLGGMAAQWLPLGKLLPRGPMVQAVAVAAVAACAVALPGIAAVALSVRSSTPLEY